MVKRDEQTDKQRRIGRNKREEQKPKIRGIIADAVKEVQREVGEQRDREKT